MTTEQAYSSKTADYFNGERRDIVDQLVVNIDAAILEIGCGDGATGAYAKTHGKCGRYVGVEMSTAAASIAAKVLDQVIVANLEQDDIDFPKSAFDVLIASEVLEHLVDPWAVLHKIRPLMKPGARIFASSPNIAHSSTLAMLIDGRWDLEESGRMDRTHLRWFTPNSFASMFKSSGYEVVSVGPIRPPSTKARIANALTGGRFRHLFMSQIFLEARVSL